MALPSIRAGGYYQSKIGLEDIPRLQARLKQAQVLAKDRIELLFMPNIPDKFLGPYYLDMDFPFSQGCDSFWKTFRVSPDGTISPCLNFQVGNITKESVAAIWNGPKMQALRRLFSNRLFPGCLF